MNAPLPTDRRTPIGPWEYFPAQNYEGFAIAPRGRLPTLAAVERKGSVTVFNYPDATEAHARLIAKAPELRDALFKLVDAIEDTMRSHEAELACCCATRSYCKEARELLAALKDVQS
jgi:hypothetical protein